MTHDRSPRIPSADVRARRGRGALSNHTGRFEPRRTDSFDDGWDTIEAEAERPATVIIPEACRNPLTTNDSPDVPFDVSLNPYKGCEHGCVYCFARPGHAYLGLSPGLDFETRIISKPDAPQRLRERLARRSYQPQSIALGSNTDPYQPAERDLRLTRQILEVLQEHRHPFSIVTKSHLVLRDLDILVPMAQQNLTMVFLSITTLEPELARTMEPRATAPAGRIEALRRLAEAGVPAGVLASPLIPGLNDVELDSILEAARGAGASFAGTALVRLPHEVKDLFFEWADEHCPDRSARIESLIKSAQGGRLYDSRFGKRGVGDGAYAKALHQRFQIACRRLGLETGRTNLDCSRFRVPPRRGENLDLFGETPTD